MLNGIICYMDGTVLNVTDTQNLKPFFALNVTGEPTEFTARTERN